MLTAAIVWRRGAEALVSFLFGPSKLPTTEFGMSTIAYQGVSDLGKFLVLGGVEHRRIVLETCHSHYPAPTTSHFAFAQPSKILGCYRAG